MPTAVAGRCAAHSTNDGTAHCPETVVPNLCSGTGQVLLQRGHRDDVSVLCVHVKEVGEMGRLRSVEDPAFDDRIPVAAGGGIDNAGSDAPTCGASDMDYRVDGQVVQVAVE